MIVKSLAQKYIIMCLAALSMPCMLKTAFADVVFLHDGSVINGKILKHDAHKSVIRNAYGIFSIENKFIKKQHITSDYREDVGIMQFVRVEVNVEEIKKNYYAGLGKSEKTYQKNNENIPHNKYRAESWMFAVSGGYMFTLGKMGDLFSHGTVAHVAYFHPLPYNSYLGCEAGYVRYKHGEKLVHGPALTLGPRFRFPASHTWFGNIVVSLMPGVTALNVVADNYNTWSYNFTAQAGIGYEYKLKNFVPFVRGTFLYIYDIDIPIYNIGIEAGIGYLF